MARRFDDDDEDRPNWFWRFLKGVVVSVVVCGAVIAVLSLYVLPPAELPPERPVAAEPAGPQVIGGIEVSQTAPYSGPESPQPAAAPEPASLGPIALAGPAMQVNAMPFEADPQTPLLAVVLDDSAAYPLLHPLIFAQQIPLTIGVVAGHDGDRETATAAEQAGFEVLAQLPLVSPGVSTGTELEYGMPEAEAMQRTELMMQRLPMAVAATRPMASSAPPNMEVLRGIGAALARHGFGYLDQWVDILDIAPARAAGLTVPVGASRFAVPQGADLATVMALLDAAAEDAGVRGGAVVLAAPSEAVIGALELWAGSGPVQLAPLSAVIGRLAGG